MDWKFESGIVAVRNKPYNTFLQRVYYVRYRSPGNLRRLITTSFTYSKLDSEARTKFIESLTSKDKQVFLESLNTTGKIVPSMSKVITIMDFDISEKGADQQPRDPRTIEKSFEIMTNDSQDENNFLTLAHFERNLPSAGIEACICTLTNDEESKRRIDEILTTTNKETFQAQSNSSGVSDDSVSYLKRILELEMFIMKQNEELQTLKDRVRELEPQTETTQ